MDSNKLVFNVRRMDVSEEPNLESKLGSFTCIEKTITEYFHSEDFIAEHLHHEICAYTIQLDNEIAGIFTLKTNAIEKDDDSVSAIEIAHYAISEGLKGNNAGLKFFTNFVRPKIKNISKLIGATHIMLFSINEPNVISAYQSMGFEVAKSEVRNFIHSTYTKECILMTRRIYEDNEESEMFF